MKTKKAVLMVLLFIFLCACSFVNKDDRMETELGFKETELLTQFDKVVERTTAYAKSNGGTEVVSVFQNEEENLWRIEFANGLIVFYDVRSEEMTHMK
jgi:hypothetical protein